MYVAVAECPETRCGNMAGFLFRLEIFCAPSRLWDVKVIVVHNEEVRTAVVVGGSVWSRSEREICKA
jgi:hypothetical protein